MFIPLGTKVPNSLIHSDSLSFRASLFLLNTFSIGVICMWLALWPGKKIYMKYSINYAIAIVQCAVLQVKIPQEPK